MSRSKLCSFTLCHDELTPPSEYIVVFKKSASREAIDEQAKQITSNGGKVGETIDSTFMKVRNVYFA
jgi:hypothetical protein